MSAQTEPGGLWGDAAIRAYPDRFDERQRPKCGVWSPLGGPCICGDPANHEPGGRFHSDSKEGRP